MGPWDHLTIPIMSDLIFLAASLAFFGFGVLYTRFCGSL